tara:strand:- start:39 stop:485 length:447 start_codon:yes stop_codon:yes gene_type:complete
MSMIINPNEKIEKDPYRLFKGAFSFMPEIQELGYDFLDKEAYYPGDIYKGSVSANPGILNALISYGMDKSSGYEMSPSEYLKMVSPELRYHHPSGVGASLGFNTPSRLPGKEGLNFYEESPRNEIELGVDFSEGLITDILKKIKRYAK